MRTFCDIATRTEIHFNETCHAILISREYNFGVDLPPFHRGDGQGVLFSEHIPLYTGWPNHCGRAFIHSGVNRRFISRYASNLLGCEVPSGSLVVQVIERALKALPRHVRDMLPPYRNQIGILNLRRNRPKEMDILLAQENLIGLIDTCLDIYFKSGLTLSLSDLGLIRTFQSTSDSQSPLLCGRWTAYQRREILRLAKKVFRPRTPEDLIRSVSYLASASPEMYDFITSHAPITLTEYETLSALPSQIQNYHVARTVLGTVKEHEVSSVLDALSSLDVQHYRRLARLVKRYGHNKEIAAETLLVLRRAGVTIERRKSELPVKIRIERILQNYVTECSPIRLRELVKAVSQNPEFEDFLEKELAINKGRYIFTCFNIRQSLSLNGLFLTKRQERNFVHDMMHMKRHLFVSKMLRFDITPEHLKIIFKIDEAFLLHRIDFWDDFQILTRHKKRLKALKSCQKIDVHIWDWIYGAPDDALHHPVLHVLEELPAIARRSIMMYLLEFYHTSSLELMEKMSHALRHVESIDDIERFLDRYSDGGDLPPPPFENIENGLVPLTTRHAMMKEGRDMRSCVGSKCDLVTNSQNEDGSRYYFRFEKGPIRATVEVVSDERGNWSFNQALGKNNKRLPVRHLEKIHSVVRKAALKD